MNEIARKTDTEEVNEIRLLREWFYIPAIKTIRKYLEFFVLFNPRESSICHLSDSLTSLPSLIERRLLPQ